MEQLTPSQRAKAALSKSTKQGTLAGLKRQQMSDVLEAYKIDILRSLPKHLKVDRFIQMALDVAESNPKLKECSASSFIGAVMAASVLGFKPVSALGECYFVPYAEKVQFQIGYRGWISLAQRSGQTKNIDAHCVYSNDEFKYSLGLHPDLKHVPAEGDRGDFKGVYAVVHHMNGGYNFVYLTKHEVEKLRMRNKMQKGAPSGAWETDYEEMAKAKAIKKLKPYLQLSDEYATTAFQSDEAVNNITDDEEVFTEAEVVDSKMNEEPPKELFQN